MSRYAIKTNAGMYRAASDHGYPWTEQAAKAHRFPTEKDARQAIRDHAAFMERPETDYRIIDLRSEAPQ